MDNNKIRPFIFGALVGVIITIIIGLSYTGIAKIVDMATKDGEYESLEDKFNEINEVLDSRYYEAFEEELLYEGAIEGYVDGIGDPYTRYYTKEEYQSFLEDTTGSYDGIGVVVSYGEDGESIIVVSPFSGSPGELAGMLPGDRILEVNNTDVTGMDLEEVVDIIKGPKGTQVVISIYRPSTSEMLDIEITRENIDVPTVAYEMLDNDIGYIELSGFQVVTDQQFFEAYNALEAEGQEGMIIDLRNNPGGSVYVVGAISDLLLPEGLIVYTEDKAGKRSELTSDEEHQFTKPLVILVNENSASASEILAGAVKDHGIGTIIGTTTFGKGLVQGIEELEDGSAIKVTISKYFTPSGNYIHGIGIEPDIYVELPEDYKNKLYVDREHDTQLQKALEVINDELK